MVRNRLFASEFKMITRSELQPQAKSWNEALKQPREHELKFATEGFADT